MADGVGSAANMKYESDDGVDACVVLYSADTADP